MCGRYQLGNPSMSDLAKMVGFDAFDEHGDGHPLELPLWNIGPMQMAPVLRAGFGGVRDLSPLKWGLVPAWASDLKFGSKTINARSEEVAKKPSFRAAWKARRCLVPASGFYEWMAEGPKRPFLFRLKDRQPMLFAGLWESWSDPVSRAAVRTFTILTRHAYGAVRPIHFRSPLVLPKDRWDAWLDPAVHDPAPILDGLPEPDLDVREVKSTINSTSCRDEPREV